MHAGSLRDQVHGLLRASDLHQAGDRVEAVRELMRLRA